MSFREFLKSVLNEKGITAGEIADNIGYSRAYLYDLVAGARRFNEETEKKICDFLGIEKVYRLVA